MRYDLFRSVIASLLLTAIFISTGDQSVPKPRSKHNPASAQSGSSEKLPSGVSQSDWGGILQAHEDWKHSIRADGDGWRTHNSETGLTARFDRRGVEIQPDGSDWTWGLDLVSHGVGKTQIYTEGIVPEVQTAGRRIGYEWNENLEEWYQNDDRGLEHGYTIRERPASTNETDSLVVRLRIRGGLRVVGSVAGRSLAFGDEKVGERLRYSDLKVLDATGRELPASFESDGENGIRIRVDDASARYPLTIDPIIQQAYLKASNAESGDLFGKSVAISGENVVVGAPGEDSSATGGPSDNSVGSAGAAYVFVRSGMTWSQQAYLKASNAGSSNNFGNSVAISGETVVVGAPENSATDAGAAYVFVRSGTTWSQQAYLKASNAGAGDIFGASVAISRETVIVGAYFEDSSATGGQSDNSATDAGAAYVFVRSGTTWSQQACLKASNAEAGDWFGQSVAISGETVVVGASQEDSSAAGGESDNSASNAGAAYVFVRSGTTWSQQAFLKASNAEGVDLFGVSVAISEETVVVGAHGEDSKATGGESDNSAGAAGAAYVFVRSGTTWSQQAYLKASNAGAVDLFGYSVAISREKVVVGAYGEDSSATGGQSNNYVKAAGAAYIFVRSGTTWSQQAYLKASNAGAGDNFGVSVAISGETVVVGAYFESSSATGGQSDNSAEYAGAAYTYLSNTTPTITAVSGVTRTAGSSVSSSTIATVTDAETSAGSLTVTVTSATTSNGVTLSNIANAAGTVTATIVAASSATSATFTLEVSDGTATATATLNVKVNQPPTITAAGGVTRTAGNMVSSSTIATVTDAETSAGSLTVTVISANPSNGVTISNIVNTAGTVTANIAAASGATSTTFTLQVSDGTATAMGILNVTVNQPPTITAASDVTRLAGRAVSRSTIATVTDAETPAGSLTVTVTSGNPSYGVTISDITNTAGMVTANIVAASSATSAIFTLEVSNGTMTATETLYVTVNQPLSITAASGLIMTAGSAVSSSAIATVTDVDVAAGSLTVRVTSANPSNGVTISNIVNAAGTVTANIVAASSATSAIFTLEVSNGTMTATETLYVTVNQPPTITAASLILSTADSTLSSSTIATVADAETSAESLTVTVTSSNPSNGVTVSDLANTAGTVTANIVAASGATSATFTIEVSDGTATASAVLIINVGNSTITTDTGKVEIPGGNGVVGPGAVVTLTQVLRNNISVPVSTSYIVTLPDGMTAVAGGCSASGGSCTLNTAAASGDHLSGVNRKSQFNAALKTVTWTGTIPANGSVTITYQVQVGVQVTSGSQYCITSMIGTTPGPTTCIRVNTPASGPGNMPIAARLPNPQKPGSLLIFNVYTSSVNTSLSDTQISLTNTNPVSPANVHLFFVDGSSCSVADQIVTLTQNQTVTFRASDVDPGVTGYLIAIAVDQSGCPVTGNYLIGVEDVRFESGHHATLPAIGVSGLGVGATPCLSNSVTTTLAFNGVQYDELPRGLGIASLPSLATGNSPMLIINRIGGDLTSGAERMGALAGLLFDDGETSRSFTLTGGLCQMRGMLGNNLPRTVPRYGTVIPAGRTGWMKFWAAGDEALTGVMINATTSGFSGGYNLQSLTTTGTATLTIPVIPVR